MKLVKYQILVEVETLCGRGYRNILFFWWLERLKCALALGFWVVLKHPRVVTTNDTFQKMDFWSCERFFGTNFAQIFVNPQVWWTLVCVNRRYECTRSRILSTFSTVLEDEGPHRGSSLIDYLPSENATEKPWLMTKHYLQRPFPLLCAQVWSTLEIDVINF